MKVDVRETCLDSLTKADPARLASVSLRLSSANSPDSVIGSWNGPRQHSQTMSCGPFCADLSTCAVQSSSSHRDLLGHSIWPPAAPHAPAVPRGSRSGGASKGRRTGSERTQGLRCRSIDSWGYSLLNGSPRSGRYLALVPQSSSLPRRTETPANRVLPKVFQQQPSRLGSPGRAYASG
jgi:hypothetical protein